ncbi:MAG: hypothetical protein JWO79_1886, partial [Actinomycetia bacterium]|nr:hypothetical protein [Actinomycetes bacterium]
PPPPGAPPGPPPPPPPPLAGPPAPLVPADPPAPRAITPRDAALASDSPNGRCVSFQNTDFGVPVRVTGIGLSGAGLAVDPQDCAGSAGATTSRVCSPGVTLDPGADGCITGVRATGTDPADYSGTVRLRLAARCTSDIDAPCDAPELAADPPSAARPAAVTWTDPGRTACFRIPAPGAPAAAGGLSCS